MSNNYIEILQRWEQTLSEDNKINFFKFMKMRRINIKKTNISDNINNTNNKSTNLLESVQIIDNNNSNINSTNSTNSMSLGTIPRRIVSIKRE